MASGVPCLATCAGGVPEVIDAGQTGLLFPVGGTEAMARGALDLLESPEARSVMAEAARAVAIDRFSLDRVVGQYERLYESLSCPAS